jgi:hypothetical protein
MEVIRLSVKAWSLRPVGGRCNKERLWLYWVSFYIPSSVLFTNFILIERGGEVVGALRYKPEGRGIDGVIGIFH